MNSKVTTSIDAYEEVIEPFQNLFRFDFKSLARYRDLLFLIVRRDFVAKYKQTILGPLWFILQPLLTTLVFTLVFHGMVRIPTDGIPPILFYLCGLWPWSFFALVFMMSSTTFTTHAQLFGKVYFPRLIVPLAAACSNLITFAIQGATFLAFYLFYLFLTPAGQNIHAHPTILILPILLLQTAALALGLGLWMSALTSRYRDFLHLMNFLVQLWMYATPIVFPLSSVPEKLKWILFMNPMTPIVTTYRYAFFGEGGISWTSSIPSVIITVAVFISGVLIFNKVERTAMDIA